MEIKNNAFYKLVNKGSGKVMSINQDSLNNNAIMVQYHDVNPDDSQELLLFKLDNNCYAFANKRSGKVVSIDQDSLNDNKNVVQYSWVADAAEEWILVAEDDSHYKFKNNNSGKVISVFQNSTADNAHLVQYKDVNPDDWELWAFKEMESITLPTITVGTLPNVPQYTSLNDNLPNTTPVVTAYTLIPCIMVTDTWSEPEKIQSTPYYIMYKKQYWKNIDSHTFAPNTSYTSDTTYGMNQTNQESMTQTTSISVTVDAGFSFGPLSSSISTTVTNELQVSQSTTTELMTEQENSETISNPNSYEVSWTKFALVTEYYVARADGTVIGNSPWVVIDKNQERESYYPLNTPPLPITSDKSKAVN